MGYRTALIVPATVPDALVTRLPHRELPRSHVLCLAPAPVPVAVAVPVVPEQLSAQQVDVLRAENAALRVELARVRAS